VPFVPKGVYQWNNMDPNTINACISKGEVSQNAVKNLKNKKYPIYDPNNLTKFTQGDSLVPYLMIRGM
jgi:hypothetical protein